VVDHIVDNEKKVAVPFRKRLAALAPMQFRNSLFIEPGTPQLLLTQNMGIKPIHHSHHQFPANPAPTRTYPLPAALDMCKGFSGTPPAEVLPRKLTVELHQKPQKN